MKHAFLIIAHSNWWQLKKLIECLDSDTHDIYVHVDKKSKDFDESYFRNSATKSSLKFYREFEVYWGGFSQVQVEMFLLKQAYANGYDYYHIISGADLPLKSNEEIDSFFEKNKGKEFILYDEDALKGNPEISRRVKYYHFLQNYRRRYAEKWKNSFFTFCERTSLVLQIIFGVNRVKNLDWQIKYGSQWVSITDELVKVILANEEKITSVFSYTNCADELFIQTIAFNCGFKDHIFQPADKQAANLRCIDWSRGKNGNPYTYRFKDIDMLIPKIGGEGRENLNLFARKFSETIDKDLIDGILVRLKNGRN